MARTRSHAIAPAAVVTLLVVLGAGAWWLAGRGAGDPAPALVAPVAVVVTRVEVRDVAEFAQGLGNVQSLNSIALRPQVDGILTEVLFEEGQNVRAGQLLARIDDRAITAALAQARANRHRNQVALDTAKSDLSRYEALARSRTISQQTVDQQAAEVAQLEAALAADDAAIAAAEVQQSYTRIESPVDGRTGLRRVDPGNLVRAGDALVTITQMDPIAVVFSLPQSLLPRVRALQSAGTMPEVHAYDRAGGTRIASGRLLLVDNLIDTATGTVRLKAEFPNPDGRLWPGQFVTAELQVGLYRDALAVDARAVQRGRDHAFVWRVVGDTVEHVPVAPGYENEEVVVITQGLAAGDVVVRDGQSRLRPGSRVVVGPGTP
jgi:RND family efflux transporter MFP subunit